MAIFMEKYSRLSKMILSVFLALLLVVILPSCTSTKDSASVKFIYARKPNPYYTVQEAETVSMIAKKFKMTEEEFIHVNRISAPYELIPGQKVIVFPKNGMQVGQNQVGENFEAGGVEVSANSEVETSTGLNLSEPADAEDGNHEVRDFSPENAQGTAKIGEEERLSQGKYHWPVKGKVTKKVKTGPNGNLSGGINISAPEGTPVYAAGKGVIVKSDVNVQGYGKTIIVKHTDGTMSVYSHLKSCTAKAGQSVDRKTIIGRVGKTGGLKKPELHFQLRGANKKYIDPLSMLE
ncbi:MAG: hypothetical protein COY39_04260 [Alphaproteobacteria bacterium CG_4_10_14_0_8_um_filter_37_21]|nr:MAG: hypothetical protein COY39_04260 [Alphaproteobacteria bacterium CG_4_10_14_0_8_um_filter_37_21]